MEVSDCMCCLGYRDCIHGAAKKVPDHNMAPVEYSKVPRVGNARWEGQLKTQQLRTLFMRRAGRAIIPISPPQEADLEARLQVLKDMRDGKKTRTNPLSNLPNEVLRMIFECADDMTAICLGLTNKRCYAILKTVQPSSVALSSYIPLPPQWNTGKFLFQLVHEWIGEDLVFDKVKQKFVQKPKWFQFRKRNKLHRQSWFKDYDLWSCYYAQIQLGERKAGGYWAMGHWIVCCKVCGEIEEHCRQKGH